MTPRPSRGEPAAVASRPAPPHTLLADVAALLADPGLAWVVQRVRGQVETGADPVAVQQLHSATAAQRTGARALLGPAAVVRGTHLSVRTSDVEELLREVTGWRGGLAAAVHALDGGAPPVEVDDHEDQDQDDDGGRVALPATADAVVAGPPAPPVVVPPVVTPPVAVPVAKPAPVSVPAPAPVPVPAPAPVPVPAPAPAPEPVARVTDLDPGDAAQVGLALADVALVLDLPVAPDGPTGTVLAALSAAGLPALVTLHQLRQAPPTWLPAPRGGTALVCATPGVLAAVAGRPAPRGRRPRVPVVCLDATATGADADPAWPGDAVVVVLEALRAAGWRLLLNAGDGPEGEVLTELLASELDAQLWCCPPDPEVPLLDQLVAEARRLAR